MGDGPASKTRAGWPRETRPVLRACGRRSAGGREDATEAELRAHEAGGARVDLASDRAQEEGGASHHEAAEGIGGVQLRGRRGARPVVPRPLGQGQPCGELFELSHVVRGGGYPTPAETLRSAYRHHVPSETRSDAIGFRCLKVKTP